MFLREWAEERGLEMGAGTDVPLWDGTRPDYDWAAAALVGGSAVSEWVRLHPRGYQKPFRVSLPPSRRKTSSFGPFGPFGPTTNSKVSFAS